MKSPFRLSQMVLFLLLALGLADVKLMFGQTQPGKPELEKFTATIKNARTNDPLPYTKLIGYSQGRNFLILADQNGTIETDAGKNTLLYAVSADKNFATISLIEEPKDLNELILKPSLTVRGRLVDAISNVPLGNHVVWAEYRFKEEERSGYSPRFRVAGRSNEEGLFELRGLAQGTNYSLCVPSFSSAIFPMSSTTVVSFEESDSSDVDLGELRANKPTEIDEDTVKRQWFRFKGVPGMGGTIGSRILTATDYCSQEGQNVLIVLGNSSETPSINVMRWLAINSEYRPKLNFFRVVGMDKSEPGKPGQIKEFCEKYSISLPEQNDVALVVLDANQNLLSSKLLSEFAEDTVRKSNGLDKESLAAVYEWLEQQTPQSVDAAQLLENAQEKAVARNARILVVECRLFDDLSEVLLDLIRKHAPTTQFEIVKLNPATYENAGLILKRLRGTDQEITPWVGVLNVEGELLASGGIPETYMNQFSQQLIRELFIRMIDKSSKRDRP